VRGDDCSIVIIQPCASRCLHKRNHTDQCKAMIAQEESRGPVQGDDCTREITRPSARR
jgi:hypothetical protein